MLQKNDSIHYLYNYVPFDHFLILTTAFNVIPKIHMLALACSPKDRESEREV